MDTKPATAVDPKSFQTFEEFYPFYLTEHSNLPCRLLHFIGSTLALAVALRADRHRRLGLAADWPVVRLWLCLDRPFHVRKNKPASFQPPALQLLGDWVMYRDIWLGKVKI